MAQVKTYVRIIMPAIVIAAIALAGYFVFLGFMNNDQTLVNLLPLAVVAGVASFFSPCAFPLLPSMVALDVENDSKHSPKAKGLLAAVGVLTFLVPLGIIIGFVGVPLGNLLQDNLNLIRSVIGVALIYLGYRQLKGMHFGFFEKHAPKLSKKNQSKTSVPFMFGFSYVMIGSGCTVPIMTALVLGALAVGNFFTATASFILAGSIMALLMFGFMTYAGSVKTMPSRITKSMPKIKKATGAILIIIGAFYIANAIFGWI